MIKVPRGTFPVGETTEEMGSAALAACQVSLPAGSKWTLDAFGQEVFTAVLLIPGYVKQARTPGIEVVAGALWELSNLAASFASAIAVDFTGRATPEAVLQDKINHRIRQELMGLETTGGALSKMGYREKSEIGPDGETRYFNSPVLDFLKDLEARVWLVKRAIDSTYELHSAAFQISQIDGRAGAHKRKGRSIGNRVVAAVVSDLLDLWIEVFGNYPSLTPLDQGRSDGMLSAGKRFPALVRFVCERGEIEFPSMNALHLEIVRTVEERRARR